MSKTKSTVPTWEECVVLALKSLGGEASMASIYAEVKKLREAAGIPLSVTWTATIRRTLQESPRTTPGEVRGIWKLLP